MGQAPESVTLPLKGNWLELKVNEQRPKLRSRTKRSPL